MLYRDQQWGEVIAEEDSAYSVGFLGICRQNPQIQHCLLAASSSNSTGNLQPTASTGKQLTCRIEMTLVFVGSAAG